MRTFAALCLAAVLLGTCLQAFALTTDMTATIPSEHSVRFNVGEGGSLEVDGLLYNGAVEVLQPRFTQLVCTPIPDPGYELAALYYNGTDVLAQLDEEGRYTTPRISWNCTLAVTFAAADGPSVTVTYTVNGQVRDDLLTTVSADENGALTLTLPEAQPVEGYFFVGWRDEDTGAVYPAAGTLALDPAAETLRFEAVLAARLGEGTVYLEAGVPYYLPPLSEGSWWRLAEDGLLYRGGQLFYVAQSGYYTLSIEQQEVA